VKRAHLVLKLHQVPAFASVVPPAFRARTCQYWTVLDGSDGVRADVDVVDVHVEQLPLVVETHHSYETAPGLAAHLSVTGERTFVTLFPGEDLENAPGTGDASVANIQNAPPSAYVVPVAFVARTSQ
jgi:hypothetical protein